MHRSKGMVLIRLATSPPGPSPGQPLPEASRESDMKITIYGWSTRRVVPHGGSFGYDAAGRLVLAPPVLAPEFVPRYDN